VAEIITSYNARRQDPGDAIPDGAVIEGGNFSQSSPGTVILAGKSLTIRGGNWCNVEPDPAWTIEGGNWARIDRCVHLHPEMGLPAEGDNCRHVTEIDTIEIDGEVVETIYHRADTVEGRAWPT
jgi:hypothetical protein